MQVKAFIERTQKIISVTLAQKATVQDLLLKLSLNPVTVLVVRDGKVLVEIQHLEDKDTLKILSVVSGG